MPQVGDENDLLSGSPWQPSCGQLWCCRLFHHFLSAGSSYWTDLIVPIPNSS
jgi:hypothetical protein